MQAPVILLANGNYPSHPVPLEKIHNARSIICCDGAINKLSEAGYTPYIIIGDLDSIDTKYKKKYQDKLYHIPEQNENDLRKAIKWLNKQKIEYVTILGATGKREDHTIGNIFSIYELYDDLKATIYTDNGTFKCINTSTEIKSYKGQQVSLFSNDKTIRITSNNLMYNFNSSSISSLFYGTLNESISDSFILNISHGKLLIYQNY